MPLSDHRALVVDLDPQGNASSGMGVSRDQGERPTIYHALLGEADAARSILAARSRAGAGALA